MPLCNRKPRWTDHCSCFQGAISCEAATQIKATKMIKRRPGTSLVDVWNQPIWKNMLLKLDHLPRDRGENQEYLKLPPPRSSYQIWRGRLYTPQNFTHPRKCLALRRPSRRVKAWWFIVPQGNKARFLGGVEGLGGLGPFDFRKPSPKKSPEISYKLGCRKIPTCLKPRDPRIQVNGLEPERFQWNPFWRIRNLSESNPEKSVIYRQQVAYVGDSPALKLTVRPWK